MANEGNVSPPICGETSTAAIDARIAVFAARQHGVISLERLIALGLTLKAIEYRIRCGRLHRLYRGVYAVGHPNVPREGRWLAAVLSCGRGAVLSHDAAGFVWGIRRNPPSVPVVSAPSKRRQRKGMRLHTAAIPTDEVTVRNAIPITTVPRTLFDLAAMLSRHQVERAIDEAEIRRLTDPLSLVDLVERHRGRPGAATIRAILADGLIGVTETRSDLEDAFLAFLDAHGLPRPAMNVPVQLAEGRTIQPDCVWSAQRLIVELDSRTFHHTSAAFEADRARDIALAAAGWTVVRVTWRRIHRDGDALAAELALLLAQAPTPAAASRGS